MSLSDFVASPLYSTVLTAARKIGAHPSDIPGLWNAPGYPELTTAQMLDASKLKPRPMPETMVGCVQWW